ncbi:MAG: FAD-binding oxidoreductase [Verrucomicrobiaceae bacterium]|nr:MAG: FAD-binding oxidoreductase [Verrucomicrobiaceae bacterium]
MVAAMKRREVIGLAISGGVMGIPACRKGDSAPAGPSAPVDPNPAAQNTAPPPEGHDLVPVRVEESLEIRTITGLRPYRPSGFVVRREDMSGKVLVHNYGHGGGGFSLSWGSARLAVDLALPVAGLECAIVGAGIMGLCTGRLLQQHGAKVAIYARELPPDTTSNVAGAQWWPFSVFDNSRRTDAFARQYVQAAEFSHRYFQQHTGVEWGVSWLPNYYLSDGAPLNGWIGGPGGVLHGLQTDFRDFAPGDHVFSKGHARRFYSMLIEPSVYLPRLMREFREAGGEITVRPFAAAAEVLSLPQPVIFNCAGLGAGALFNDRELMPIKGQLTFLMPQPEVRYNLMSGDCYMFPRRDGILLGGTYETGQWDPAPDPQAKARILAEQRRIFRTMADIQRAPRGSGAAPKSI